MPNPKDYAILFDASRCIGCKACQVACKQWNDLEAEKTENRGSYANPPQAYGPYLDLHALLRGLEAGWRPLF